MRRAKLARHVGWVALLLAALAVAPRVRAQECDAGSQGLSSGSPDNSAALAHLLESCAGKAIDFPAGTFTFAPKGYANGFDVRSGTKLRGAQGPGGTTFRIAEGGTFAALLWVRDQSHVAIQGIRFVGSPYDSGCSHGLDYGHAINVYSTKGAAAPIEDLDISGDTFVDFNGGAWLAIDAQDGSPGIGADSLIRIVRNTFTSDAPLTGSCAELPINYMLAMISVHGSDLSNQGLVANVAITQNVFQADYVKQGIAIWSGTSRLDVSNNDLRNVGLRIRSTQGELGRYAINIYNSAHEKPGMHPSNIQVTGNKIQSPVSCGIYVASGRRIEIAHNVISGQRDPFDVTLPKGAISLNHAEETNVHDNQLSDNHIGINSVAGTVQIGANAIAPAAGGIRTKKWASDRGPPSIER